METKTEILTSIRGHNSVTNVRKLMPNNPNLDLVNINPYIQNLVKFYIFVLKILSGNEIVESRTSIKGYNSVSNLRKMMPNDLNLDFININAYTKFGKISVHLF